MFGELLIRPARDSWSSSSCPRESFRSVYPSLPRFSSTAFFPRSPGPSSAFSSYCRPFFFAADPTDRHVLVDVSTFCRRRFLLAREILNGWRFELWWRVRLVNFWIFISYFRFCWNTCRNQFLLKRKPALKGLLTFIFMSFICNCLEISLHYDHIRKIVFLNTVSLSLRKFYKYIRNQTEQEYRSPLKPDANKNLFLPSV